MRRVFTAPRQGAFAKTINSGAIFHYGRCAVGLLPMAHPDQLELSNARGERRGHVEPRQVAGRHVLEDLWVMQGSVCDLRCKHCYTASSPSNNRLEQVLFAEIRPHLEDAGRFGVQTIYFTGGKSSLTTRYCVAALFAMKSS